jgi:ribonuclease-3
LSVFKKPIRVYFSPDKKFYESLRNIIGFYPGNIELYRQAFRHTSAAIHLKDGLKNSNERLEFLGDSIIGSVVAEYLFKKFPFKDEGFLTKMRSKIVSRNQHNQIALKMGLNKFVEAQSDRFGGKPSSINGDAYEALIGAIYLDKGYAVAKDFLINRIINVHIDIDELETKEIDFKSKLIEWAQKEKKEYRFEVVEDGAITVDKNYLIHLVIDNHVLGKAQHFSKKRAEQLAAEQACLILQDAIY